VTLLHADYRYYLARQTGPMAVELVDGCHGHPDGVAKAAKVHGRIFGDQGPWFMVEIHALPDDDPSINEEAAAICARLIEGAQP
jgi:hypothetical protein